MERTLDFLSPQQSQPHIPQACPILASCLPGLSEHRGARSRGKEESENGPWSRGHEAEVGRGVEARVYRRKVKN